MHEEEDRHRRTRYTLIDTEHGHAWGSCAEVEGLFGEPPRGTYELFGWVPETPEARGWLGSRVWLVAEDETLGPWLLEDAENLLSRTGGLVLTGLDDYEGPPEGYAGPVRVHDGRQWLGACREFARVLPLDQSAPPLVLRGLTPGDQLRAALGKGTRRALDLGQTALEIRDEQGELLTERLLWTTIRTWRPSTYGSDDGANCETDLIDLELAGELTTPVPEYARPLWDRWLAGPPDTPGAWADLDTRRREAWLDLVRERACRRTHHDRPAGHPYALDGRHTTDEPGLYLALGEAVNGPGGYFGACQDALTDCLRGAFGHTPPGPLHWRNAATAREYLSKTLTAQGHPYDLFTATLDILADGGMDVTLA